ncbi:MAG TPA: iron-sulfur protein, partial [Pseudonocardiaceae bacterium]|nr:iron-sulfur protein [Pseudonocardiaceae bacterium]
PGTPADNRWVRCADLLGDPSRLSAWADRLTAWLLREYGEAPARTVAGYLLGWYLTVPAQVAALLFHTERRVPAIGPASLAVRFDPDHPRPDAIAVLDPDFACLADDPAAGAPGITVMDDDVTLAALLRGRYAAHAVRFLEALERTPAGRVRLGRRTLWGTVTDVLDGAFWRIGQYCGDEAAGAANAALALPGVLPPFTTASTLRPAASPEDGWTRRRDSCCFHYVLTAGMGPCATCPRVCER